MAALLTLGRCLSAIGDTESSLRTFVVALADATGSGNPGGIADAVDGLAEVSCDSGDIELAVELTALSDALREQRHVAVPSVVTFVRRDLIDLFRAQLDPSGYAELRRAGAQRDVHWVVERVTAERPGTGLAGT